MKKSVKIPVLILAIGLVLTLVVCLFTNVILTPAITEHSFPFSVTYKLAGETKTVEGIYTCKYDGYSEGGDPDDRYYTEEYTFNGETGLSRTYTIAEKDGAEIYIVLSFNDCYLMNDTKDEGYEAFLEEPYLESLDKEGCELLPEDRPAEFAAEIVSWEYPKPIDNQYQFSGFSLMHDGSMIAMLVVGLLVVIACVIFVRKEKELRYNVLDILSIVLNCAICILAIPFITLIAAFFQIAISTDSFVYQFYMLTPVITAFGVAASIVLRRKGLRKTGFFIQFIGPALFVVPMVVEFVATNFS